MPHAELAIIPVSAPLDLPGLVHPEHVQVLGLAQEVAKLVEAYVTIDVDLVVRQVDVLECARKAAEHESLGQGLDLL